MVYYGAFYPTNLRFQIHPFGGYYVSKQAEPSKMLTRSISEASGTSILPKKIDPKDVGCPNLPSCSSTTQLFWHKFWMNPKNNGTPKSSILIGFSIINHPFWGTPIFGNTHIFHQTESVIDHPSLFEPDV